MVRYLLNTNHIILICLAKRKDKIPICKFIGLRIGTKTLAELISFLNVEIHLFPFYLYINYITL